MVRQDHPREEVIIFTRYPLAGKVKTRLIPHLGSKAAARIHKHLAERVFSTVRDLLRSRETRITLWYTGGTRQQMRAWVDCDIPIMKQQGNSLGQRMADAFHAAWASGTERAVLIGTDCPGLDAPLIAQALDELHTCDMVIGPASDGGYYLIGLHRKTDNRLGLLFNNIAWGSAHAFNQTLAQANTAGLTTSTLKELHDIDRPEDLKHLRHHSDPE